MRSLNEVNLLGNVGNDPTVKATAGGSCVASLSLATSYQSKEKQEVTEWHRLVCFGRTAEIVRDYVVKGSKLFIKGQLQTRKWEKDGQTHYSTEVVIRDLSLLNNRAADASKKSALKGGAGDTAGTIAGTLDGTEISDDDIPF